MNRNRTALGSLLVAAAVLVATGASAQNPHAAPPGKANAADKADNAKPDDKANKAKPDDKANKNKPDDKADKAKGKADADGGKDVDASKAKGPDDHAARKAKEHAEQRAKLASSWKGPVSEALRQELRRHAERLARLARIEEVAGTEKDKDNADKATKLIAKENARHDKWMSNHATGATPAAAASGQNEGGK